jgi:hypothetical protein
LDIEENQESDIDRKRQHNQTPQQIFGPLLETPYKIDDDGNQEQQEEDVMSSLLECIMQVDGLVIPVSERQINQKEDGKQAKEIAKEFPFMAEQEDAKDKGHDASKDDLKSCRKTHIPPGKRMDLPYPLHTHPFRK